MMCLRPSVLTDQNRGSAFQTTPDAKPDCVSSGMSERLLLAGPSSDRRILPQSPDLDCVCGRRNTFLFTLGCGRVSKRHRSTAPLPDLIRQSILLHKSIFEEPLMRWSGPHMTAFVAEARSSLSHNPRQK